MSSTSSSKPFPSFKTDEEAEPFVDEADLSTYDFPGFAPRLCCKVPEKVCGVGLRLGCPGQAAWSSS